LNSFKRYQTKEEHPQAQVHSGFKPENSVNFPAQAIGLRPFPQWGNRLDAISSKVKR
jgi:hypothetical protein